MAGQRSPRILPPAARRGRATALSYRVSWDLNCDYAAITIVSFINVVPLRMHCESISHQRTLIWMNLFSREERRPAASERARVDGRDDTTLRSAGPSHAGRISPAALRLVVRSDHQTRAVRIGVSELSDSALRLGQR